MLAVGAAGAVTKEITDIALVVLKFNFIIRGPTDDGLPSFTVQAEASVTLVPKNRTCTTEGTGALRLGCF
jgi:hypothetical protein